MLIDGPTEWSEALLGTSSKANLLQNGYNPKLQMSAMSLGSTVVITHYEDTNTTLGFGPFISCRPNDTLVLHEDGVNSDETTPYYRLLAWSEGPTKKSLLAIASSTEVEIWEVTVSSGILATLKSSVHIDHLLGISWNPCHEILLAFSKTEMLLVNASQPVCSWRKIYTASKNTHQAWGASSWSPCGLQLSIAQNHLLHCFGWTNVESLLSEPPKHEQIDARSPLKDVEGTRLDTGNGSLGPIAAVARVSPTICILTTETKLVLEDITISDPMTAPTISEFMKPVSIGTGSAFNLLLRPVNSHHPEIQEHGAATSSDIIDLTRSISVSSNSVQRPLRILNYVEHTATSHAKPRSHLLIVEYRAKRWTVVSILDLPHLSSPDVLVVQEMRAIVGSTTSPHLLVVHMDISDRMEWTASLSSELELPLTHVCRGLHFAAKSSFVCVASTEKHKRATFFHTISNSRPQPVYLSSFTVARRKSAVKLNDMELPPAIAADTTSRSSENDNCKSGQNKDLLDLILVKMTAMQTQLNTRFDDVDNKLLQLTVRLEQLERKA